MDGSPKTCSKYWTGADPSMAESRPRSSRSGRHALRIPRRTRRRRRSSAQRRKHGSRTSCASPRRRGRSGAIPKERSTNAGGALANVAVQPSVTVNNAADGSGTVSENRLYQLIRQPAPIRERLVEIEFLGVGAEAYCFTFG